MKKILMITLPIIFILLTFGVAAYFRFKTKVPAVSLLVTEEATPTPTMVISPTLSSNEELVSLENDLERIKTDAEKIKEDSRFNPPAFLFELGITD